MEESYLHGTLEQLITFVMETSFELIEGAGREWNIYLHEWRKLTQQWSAIICSSFNEYTTTLVLPSTITYQDFLCCFN